MVGAAYRVAWGSVGLVVALAWSAGSLRADTPHQLFVERACRDLLGRAPDLGNLATLAGDLDAAELTRSQVATRLDDTDEFRGLEVQQQYQALLHHTADPLALNGWVGALGSGTIVEQLQSNLAGSSDYYLNRGGGTDSGFLTALYPDLLGRPITPMERLADEGALSGGESRTNLAAGLLGSSEYDQALVANLFEQYLRRPVDPTNRQFYGNLLQSGARDEQVIADLVGTDEYYSLPLLPGDANFDQSVGFDDLVILARNYGKASAHWFDGDFNGDGIVGFADLVGLARDYGKSAAIAVAVEPAIAQLPEPSSLLVGIGAAALLRRRRPAGDRALAQ